MKRFLQIESQTKKTSIPIFKTATFILFSLKKKYIKMSFNRDLRISNDILSNSPSKIAGIPKEIENKHRRFCCELIQDGGILLEL